MLGKRSFSLPAKKLTKLRVHLSKAARKQLKGAASIKATLTAKLTLRNSRKPKTYVSGVVLSSHKPTTAKPPAAKTPQK